MIRHEKYRLVLDCHFPSSATKRFVVVVFVVDIVEKHFLQNFSKFAFDLRQTGTITVYKNDDKTILTYRWSLLGPQSHQNVNQEEQEQEKQQQQSQNGMFEDNCVYLLKFPPTRTFLLQANDTKQAHIYSCTINSSQDLVVVRHRMIYDSEHAIQPS